MKILFINSCVRTNSRTKILANYLLSKLDGEIEEVALNDINIAPLTSETLKQRDELIINNNFDDKMFDLAKQFVKADIVVIAAPFWDLSFPSLLKTYFELINVVGITFVYTEDGMPKSLCNAKQLFYVSTSGGPVINSEYGFGYVKALSNIFYGINDIKYIQATKLDVIGNNIEEILNNTKVEIDKIFE